MLRKDLKRATEKILQVLSESKIDAVLETLLATRQENPDRSQALRAFASYMRFYDDFREPEIQLISILELGCLMNLTSGPR